MMAEKPSTSKRKWQFSDEEKKMYNQKFRKEWLSDPKFEGWIAEDKDIFKARCSVCNITLHAGKSELQKHSATQKHIRNWRQKNLCGNIPAMFSEQTEEDRKKKEHERKVKEAEIKLAYCFAKNNVAFRIIDDLIPLLKNIFPDSRIAQDVQLGRTKCTNIIKNVLAQKDISDLVEILKTTKFSILVDETTDIAMKKLLCVLVKYVHQGKPYTKLLEIIEINAKDSSAESLYQSLKECFNKKGIPVSNIIGLACDNANVMTGCNNSLKTRLAADTEYLICLPCICHTSAIISSKACLKLPRSPEDLLRAVSTYTSSSAKRTAELHEFQTYMQTEYKKIIKLSNTRWLCLQHCVVRVLENWNVLKELFRLAAFEDKLRQSEFILELLTNDANKAYLYFLKYVLSFFNTLNALFQSKCILIHELSIQSQKIYKSIMSNFIKPDKLNLNIDCSNPNNFLPLENIFLGSECNNYINTLPDNCKNDIRISCLDFYVVAATEIKNRLPIKNELFDSFIIISPKIALSANRPKNVQSLNLEVFSIVKDINLHLANDEWRKLPFSFNEQEVNDLCQLTIEDFWQNISKIKDINGCLEYKNLVDLVRIILTMPHSNADAERVFSVVSDVKTKKRNKISSAVLNAVCCLRQNTADIKPHEFKVTEAHHKLMEKTNLYSSGQ